MGFPLSVYRRLPRGLPLSLGFSRYGLLFDGVGGYVDTLLDPSTELGQEITVSAWVYPTAQNNHRGIWGAHGITGTKGIHLQYSGGWAFGFGDGTDWHSVNIGDLTLNSWVHLVVVFKGGSGGYIKVYKNLVEVGSVAVTTNIVHEAAFWVGRAYNAADRYFSGIIDEVCVYNRILSAAEMRHNMVDYHNPVRDELVMWLPFEEGSGLTAYDGSGQGNDGSLLPAAGPPAWRRNAMWELRAGAGL